MKRIRYACMHRESRSALAKKFEWASSRVKFFRARGKVDR
jgi:hypothetical protein